MNVSELLNRTEYRLLKGRTDAEVTGICFDNRKIRQGDAFVCIRGVLFDTHDVIAEIAAAGPSVIITDEKWAEEHSADDICPGDTAMVSVADTRAAKAAVSAAWYGYPSEKMTVIGITGSKGKTTTSHMLWSMLSEAGVKAGLVSTAGGYIGGQHVQFGTSTPDSDKMQEFLSEMADQGCSHAVVECSSQGLKLHRTDLIDFDLGIFLNIEKGDHISPTEHKDFAEYLDCKRKLLRASRTCIVNADDEHIDEMIRGVRGRIIRYGSRDDASEAPEKVDASSDPGREPSPDYVVSDVKEIICDGKPCISFRLEGKEAVSYGEFTVGMPGVFNSGNAAASCIAALECGISAEDAGKALIDIRVPGRLDMVYRSDELSVCVDYAHNGLSTRNLLKALRSYGPRRIVCVFGCGGNRDVDRRPEMGEASGNLADLSIITTEHNRFEEFSDILKGIMEGMARTQGKYEIIEDRKEAIRHAIVDSEPGDLVAILGIGNDGAQHDHGRNIPHDDISYSRECVDEWLSLKRKEELSVEKDSDI